MTRTLAIAAAVLLLAGSLPAAELPPQKWWKQSEISTSLALSEAQQKQLDQIFRKSASELIDMRAEADKLAIRLHAELDQKTLNEHNLQKIAGQLNDAHGKLFQRELAMLVEMRKVLSDLQWSKLQQRLDTDRHRK